MKLATVSGVSFSNNVHRNLPAVVSNTAAGWPEPAGFAAVAGFCAGALAAGVWAQLAPEITQVNRTKARYFCIRIYSLMQVRFNQECRNIELYDSLGQNHLLD